jgi:CBS domain-containing protein
MAKTVEELMTERPRGVLPDASATEAAELMRAEDIGAVPIVDKDGLLLGIVTDRDLALRVVALGSDPRAVTVGDIATTDLVTASPDSELEAALVSMAQNRIRRLPIVDEAGVLVGILAQADIALGVKEKDTGDLVAEISTPPEGPRV